MTPKVDVSSTLASLFWKGRVPGAGKRAEGRPGSFAGITEGSVAAHL